jgi:hypothetical protein
MPEDQALARLQAILARPEYQATDTRPWWEQLVAPVLELIVYLFGRLVEAIVDASTGRQGWIGFVALAICVGLFAFAGVYLVRAIGIAIRRDDALQTQTLAERRQRSERLWQSAQELAARGEWSDAIRALYLSALYALDERSLLHVESSLTNREHARVLERGHPELAATFAPVVESYDAVRYGGSAPSPATFADLSALVTRARSAALGGVASG